MSTVVAKPGKAVQCNFIQSLHVQLEMLPSTQTVKYNGTLKQIKA